MKNPEDVIVMKKLTTRGLQALAGGPSKLRSVRGTTASNPDVASASSTLKSASERSEIAAPEIAPEPLKLQPAPEPPAPARAIMDSAFEVTPPRGERAVAIPQLNPHEDASVEIKFDPSTLKSQAPLPKPVPPPLPAEAMKKKTQQMAIATPPTLINSQQAIPDDIRQLAIKSLEMQKTQQAPGSQRNYVPPPSSHGAVAVPSSVKVKAPVSPVPPAPLPGAPAVVKGASPVQIVVRREQRKTAFGWTAMLLALGVFIGLATVAVAHGDARQAYDVLKQYASQKRQPVAASPAPETQALPAPDPVATTPDSKPADPTPTANTKDTKVADNKPADAKDTPKPKPDPKPEVTKPDPAPRPAPKPANAYAKADKSDKSDDKPEPKVAAAPPPPPKATAPAKAKPEKDDKDDKVAAKPEPPKPAPAAAAPSDDVAKISQMAQQQLGAALP